MSLALPWRVGTVDSRGRQDIWYSYDNEASAKNHAKAVAGWIHWHESRVPKVLEPETAARS